MKVNFKLEFSGLQFMKLRSFFHQKVFTTLKKFMTMYEKTLNVEKKMQVGYKEIHLQFYCNLITYL